MMRQLGAACIVVTLSLSQALAMSPGEAFEKLVEGKSLEECLAQPDDACVFDLTVTAAKESRDDDESLRDVARMQARGGFFERALSAASGIDDLSHWYPWALADIVVEQARDGLVEEAIETADAVWRAGAMFPGKLVRTRNPLWYIRSLCAIASAQARSGDDDAKKNLTAAIAIAEQSKRSELYAIGRAWHYIVKARLDVDGLVGAQRSLESMRHADSSARWVIPALNDVAMAQASAGLESQALESFSEARRLATEMDSAQGSTFYLSRVAVAQTKAGYVSHAATSFREAVETARKVQNISTRIDVLSDVSQAQREAGLHEDADAMAKIAVEAARARVDERTAIKSRIFDEELKIAEALRDLASAQILAGRIREAENTVDRIRGFSQFHYAWAMAELAIAQWRAGRGSDAVATIDAAQESARKIDSRMGRMGNHWYSIKIHWYKIAVAKATVGDVRGALRIGEQHTDDTRFHIFQGVAELIAEG